MHKTTGPEARFLDWVRDKRFTLDPGFTWAGTRVRYPATCPEGHACGLLPYSLKAGQGGCRECGRKAAGRAKSGGAQERFLSWIRDNGFTLAPGFTWTGSFQGYPATCPAGHSCAPWPNSVQQGKAGCSKCSRAKLSSPASVVARDRFVTWADDNGFTLDQPFQWKGAMTPHPATCPKGHVCAPSPSHVNRGIGGCNACRGASWDAFYVVCNDDSGAVKFGVTSGDSRPRLRDHAKHGFTRTVLVREGLADKAAHELEQELIRLMRCAGVTPVHGREYYPIEALNVVESFARGWLDVP